MRFLMTIAGVAFAAFAITPTSNAAAQSSLMASEWTKVYESRVRMIAGDTDFISNGWSYAGVQLQLAGGWKTYWRSPGDTGVPPSFDWSGSKNLKEAIVQFPAPNVYKDAYSTAIGYKHEVVLPIRIVAMNPNKPVEVKLRFGYGLCEQICVPGEADLQLVLPPRQAGHDALLSSYRAQVPKLVKAVDETVNGMAIKKVVVKLDGDKPHIAIDARLPAAAAAKAQLFAEAKDFYLPLPKSRGVDTDGTAHYEIDLTKADPIKRLRGRTLALTLVDDHTGIEYHHKIN